MEKETARLEDAIAHTTVSLNEEKKMVAQIKELGKSKELVRAYAEAQGKISGDDGNRKAIIDRLKAKDGEIDAVKAEQTTLRGELTATKKKEDKAVSDVPKLSDERDALYESIKANREKIRALRDEHKKKEDAYYERERLWRARTCESRSRSSGKPGSRNARLARRRRSSGRWRTQPEPFEAEVTAPSSSSRTSPSGTRASPRRRRRRRRRAPPRRRARRRRARLRKRRRRRSRACP